MSARVGRWLCELGAHRWIVEPPYLDRCARRGCGRIRDPRDLTPRHASGRRPSLALDVALVCAVVALVAAVATAVARVVTS